MNRKTFTFSDSLDDALVALSYPQTTPKIKLQFTGTSGRFDSDSSSSDSPTDSDTSYSSCTNSNNSLTSLIPHHQHWEAESIDNVRLDTFAELNGEITDVTVIDRGTHTLTRTVIRPYRRTQSPFNSIASMLSPPSSRCNTPFPRTPSPSPSSAPPTRHTPSPINLISRPTSPILDGLRKVESLFTITDPHTSLSKSFEEDLDHKENQWYDQKLEKNGMEVYVHTEEEVVVEVEMTEKLRKFFGIQTRKPVYRRSRGRGPGLVVNGPRDQPRKAMFSPPTGGNGFSGPRN